MAGVAGRLHAADALRDHIRDEEINIVFHVNTLKSAWLSDQKFVAKNMLQKNNASILSSGSQAIESKRYQDIYIDGYY
jgi:hypothetical protein